LCHAEEHIDSVTHLFSVILVLQKNTTLKELLLSGNRIGDEGGKAIGKALEVSPAFVSSFSFSCAVTSLSPVAPHFL
jgi:Ran GTPase-activating protein (RanGAP) involved in mRNA processing and transport